MGWFRYPYVTGTSVVAIKYKDGILMASDMGGSSTMLGDCTLQSILEDGESKEKDESCVTAVED